MIVPIPQSKMKRIQSHLHSKMKNGCPLCGGREWSVSEDLHFVGILDPEYKQAENGRIAPLVMVTCTNCQFSFHMPAMAFGIIE